MLCESSQENSSLHPIHIHMLYITDLFFFFLHIESCGIATLPETTDTIAK